MTSAYPACYIESAQRVLGQMLDYAVCRLLLTPDDAMQAFIRSGIARQFGGGSPKYTVGMSGIELAREVLVRVSDHGWEKPFPEPDLRDERTPYWWCGWTLAYYQWQRALPFAAIQEALPAGALVLMYDKYHEQDIRQSVDEMDRRIRLAAYRKHLKLAAFRQAWGLSQRGLAEASGVPVRTVQQYEQGQKDIRKAAYSTVESLARALHCRPEDLLGGLPAAEEIPSGMEEIRS